MCVLTNGFALFLYDHLTSLPSLFYCRYANNLGYAFNLIQGLQRLGLQRLTLILLLGNSTPLGATTPINRIDWVKNNAPPFYINQGTDAEKGFADGIQALLEQALPQFQHHTVSMPLARLHDFWRKQENYCFAAMTSTSPPINTDYLLSQPTVYYLPYGIVTRANFFPASHSSIMPLQAMLTHSDWVLGLIKDRSFGSTLDNLLFQHPDITRTFVRDDRDGLQRLLKMLLLGRIDYLIDYPFVYHYYQQQPEFAKQLQFKTIAETDGQGVLGAVGCTNNDWGKQVIADINSALNRLLPTVPYQRFVADWQAVGIDQQQYWQIFERALKNNDARVRTSP